MAIFASTTTSGYSDPLKAMSIKALEQRQRDMLAQQAQQPGITPENTQTPIQGFGHVANQFADTLRSNRVDQAVAAQKQQLAQMIAQGPQGPNGEYSPQQLSVWSTADPEGMKQALQTMAENRRHAATVAEQRYGHDTTAATAKAGQGVTAAGNQLQADVSREGYAEQAARETARLEAAEKAAKEKVRTDEIAAGQLDTATRAREAQKALDLAVEKRAEEDAKEKAKLAEFERNKTLPQNDLEKLTLSLGRKPTEEEIKAAINKITSKSPSEEKLVIEERNKAVEYQSTLKQLDKAYELISSPKGIHSGSALMTPFKTGVGSVIPQSLGGPDDETQANTMQFNQIMKSQGLQNLLAMKGASSDKDVTLNLEIANDVKQPLARRKEALEIARNRLYTHVKANEEDIKRIGGEYPSLQTAPGGSAPADRNAAARAWLADPANKANPDYEAVRRKVEGK